MLERVVAMAERLAEPRGLAVRAYLVSDDEPHVRVEFLAGGEVTCWFELGGGVLETGEQDAAALDDLVALEATRVLQMRHGRRPA